MAKKRAAKVSTPSARTRKLEIVLQAGPPLLNVPIAVEVVSSGSKTVWKGAIPIGVPHVVLLNRPGPYSVQATLPSGQRRVKVADLSRRSELRVEFSLADPSTSQTLAWAKIARPNLLRNTDTQVPGLQSAWLRLWRDAGDGHWSLDEWPVQEAVRVDGLVQYNLQLRQRLGQYYIQVGSLDTPWRLIAVPAEDLCVVARADWESATDGGINQPTSGGPLPRRRIVVDVASVDGAADALLAYLSSGHFEEAREVSKTLLAEQLLSKKKQNPTAAAAAGYYLLNLKQPDDVHRIWANNLADWVQWLPDGAVIDAWYNMRRSKPNFSVARQRLLEAATRGLPIYTRGLRLLLDGLAAFEDDPKYSSPAVSEALKFVRRYGAAADWKSPMTTFVGSDPMSPGRLEFGRPDSPSNFVFVDPDDDDLAWLSGQHAPPASASAPPSVTILAAHADTQAQFRVARREQEAASSPPGASTVPPPAAVNQATATRVQLLGVRLNTPIRPIKFAANTQERLIARLLRATDAQSDAEQISGTMPVAVRIGNSEPIHLQGSALERIVGTSDLLSIAFLERGLAATRTVGRVSVYQDDGGVAHATGFLVSPALVLTANHVLPNADVCARACIEFNFEDGADGRLRTPISVPFEPSAFFIADPKMDFSLVALKDRDAGRKFGWNRLSEDEVKALVGEYLSIVQHSAGTPKQVALRELCIIDISDPYFYCEARTVVGSSGSPLFNDQWEVVGMHRLALPSGAQKRRGSVRLSPPKENETKLEYARMEVLRVSRILKAIRTLKLSKDQEILREEMLFAKPSGSIGAVSV